MALAQISNVAQSDELWVGVELAGRYSIEAALARMGAVQTFRAIDGWLEREVVLAIGSAEGRSALIDSGKAVARITNPHVVNVYGCEDFGEQSFVVFERPPFTFAAFLQGSPEFWADEARATKAAQEIVIGVIALRRAGVTTRGLHLGSIGMDDSGRVQLSPWPLSDPSLELEAASPLGDLALVTSFLEASITE